MNTDLAYLEVRELEKNWPDTSIRVSFSLDEGKMLAILGQSGSGKSTVLRMISGLLRPDGGTIMLNGTDITGMNPGKRNVGMVFQEHALFPHMRVEDNVAYGLAVRGVGRKERRHQAAALLERFGLAGFEKRWPDSLSGGERQRVALARTLAVKPRLVLFDEPLSSLDAPLRRKLRAEIRTYQQQLGFTGILVTHDILEAQAAADHVIILKKGIPVWQGTPELLTEDLIG